MEEQNVTQITRVELGALDGLLKCWSTMPYGMWYGSDPGGPGDADIRTAVDPGLEEFVEAFLGDFEKELDARLNVVSYPNISERRIREMDTIIAELFGCKNQPPADEAAAGPRSRRRFAVNK